MSVSAGPKGISNGLVFYYDMGNIVKSWKGRPTTNFIYTQNPRIDSTYDPYVATTSGTWTIKHPDAIRVYNDLGAEITGYVNTGVVDYTNTYHGIWVYDSELKMPVVVLRDYDGQWKAKSFGLGLTMTDLGLGYGSTYTISWLQWTDNIAKSINAGIYGVNTSAVNNFHDGLSQSTGPSAFNTKVATWQRLYATFTVSNVWNLTAGLSCYMYGHYNARGVVKISDVQLEVGQPSAFTKQQTRSNTQSILDIVGNRTVTLSNATYNLDGTLSFLNNTGFTIPSINFPSEQTIEIWLKPEENDSSRRNPYNQAYGGYGTLTHEPSGNINYYYGDGGGNLTPYVGHTSSFTVLENEISCICVTRDTTQSIWYKNGILSNTYPHSFSDLLPHDTTITIGSGYAGGYYGRIYAVKLYDRKLSSTEIAYNFNSLRGRFGI